MYTHIKKKKHCITFFNALKEYFGNKIIFKGHLLGF